MWVSGLIVGVVWVILGRCPRFLIMGTGWGGPISGELGRLGLGGVGGGGTLDGCLGRRRAAPRAGSGIDTLNGAAVTERDSDREVWFDDDVDILPDQTRDDTDAGWGERSTGGHRSSDVTRLLDERPPHWG